MPLISIITPVFNSAKWLPETLATVRNQTVGDWEHIFVDDGSSDDSIELIQQAAENDPRIRLLKMPENGGPAKARNKGIEAARGRYIAFLDADDLWLPEKLERCTVFMRETGYVFIYHDYRHMSADGKRTGAIVRGPDKLTLRKLHTRRGTGGCLSVVIDHERVPEFHFPNSERSFPEDFLAWLRLLRNGHEGHRLPFDLGRYRISEASRSSNKFACATAVWRLYRYEEGLTFAKSVCWWTQYAWNAFWMHRRARPS